MIFKGKELISMAANSYVRVKDVAKELDISQMTISRIERKVVQKLRKEYER